MTTRKLLLGVFFATFLAAPGCSETEKSGPMEGDSPGTGSGTESSGAPDWMDEDEMDTNKEE